MELHTHHVQSSSIVWYLTKYTIIIRLIVYHRLNEFILCGWVVNCNIFQQGKYEVLK